MNAVRRAKIIDACVFMAALVGIAVVANAIVVQPNAPSFRLDLTQNDRYTLSPTTTELLEGLKEPVLVRVFLSDNLPYPNHNLGQQLSDLLEEYALASKGRLSYDIVTPGPVTDDSVDPAGFGIRKIPVGTRGDDQVAVRLVYQGVAFIQGDRQQSIPEIRGGDNLEYELTKRLKLVTTQQSERRRVGFLKGFGGAADQPQFLPSIQRAFSHIYGSLITVELVELSDKKPVPEHLDALILLNPTQTFDPQSLLAVDQFLMRGKAVGWFQDGVQANPQLPKHPGWQPLTNGLRDFFASYGIQHHGDLLLDRTQNAVGTAFADGTPIQVQHPGMLLLTDIDRSSSMTKDVPQLVFPMASSITLPVPHASLQVVPLVHTSPHAVRRNDNFDVSYQSLIAPVDEETEGRYLVAGAVQGQMPSHFAGLAAQGGGKLLTESGPSARVLVAGSGGFMFPNAELGYSQNQAGLGALFMINGVDWLVQDEGLASIRSKGIPRVAHVASRETRLRYQLANIIGVPALVGLLGVLVFLYRRQRRRRIAL